MGMVTGVVDTAKQVVKRRITQRGLLSGNRPEDPARWRIVTIDLAPQEVLPDGKAPAPLADWQDAIELRTVPAPGGRGTELGARLRDPYTDRAPDGLDGETPVQKLRSALRRAKQLLETGEVLRADEPSTTEQTVTNAPLRSVIKDSGGEGRL